MNRLIPIILFCLGLGLLGWWAQKDHAHRMERHVQEGAEVAIGGPWRHGVELEVSGRDILISGTAHDTLEKAKMLSSLEIVEGHRVIYDELDLLPVADIYALEAMKDESGLILTGVVADDAQRMLIQSAYPEADINGISLASGEPNEEWALTALVSLQALDALQTGTMRMEETVVFISGKAPDVQVKAGVEAQLVTLPAPYRYDTQISAPQEIARIVPRDPSAPAVIQGGSFVKDGLSTNDTGSSLSTGAVVEGRLPTVVAVNTSSNTFETPVLNTDDIGENSDPEPVLDDEVVSLRQTLENAQEVATLSPPAKKEPTAPAKTAPTLVDCQAQTDAILNETQVSFVPSSADLEPDANELVLKLADVMAACVRDSNFVAIVSGHTDSQGSEDDNLLLSEERARTVAAQLTANGLPENRLMWRGFGESQPIADNETVEGRAANRRTEIRWVNN